MEDNLLSKNNTSKSNTLKKIASNLPRAGVLAIPGFGPAIEKAIFGTIDDKKKEEERQQLNDTLSDLRFDFSFAQAGLKDQIRFLAEKIKENNLELAEKIEQLDPVNIENFIVQEIKPNIINIAININSEELRSLSNIAGILPGEISSEEIPENIGVELLDTATSRGRLHEFLSKLIDYHPSLINQFYEKSSASNIDTLKETLIDSSRSLLRWPTTLGNNIWLPRGELDLLEERVFSKEGTTNLILGNPGVGKSAILASLGQRLINNRVPVLAIKADMLPSSIKNFDDLDSYLNIPLSVIECLSIVSKSGPAVLIIDQLDAISEFVDRNSERLNLLLDLIQISSRISGLHIVSSCRWFEYQHDIRLTTIEAEKISIKPPQWEEVKNVLKDVGFVDDHWSSETQSLLSVPLHLKILLDLKSRDSEAKVPSSLQGLLENIWQQRVIAGENGLIKLQFIDRLCKKMSEEEELWVPRAIADSDADILEELQQANIVQLDHSGLKIGFVHQTYLDFARSRAFSRGKEELSKYVFQRQDGLFIRPILLSSLEYLRGASLSTYNREVKKLWENKFLRSHLRNLLFEYLGGVDKPNETEISCILPMLDDQKLKFRIILAMAGSPGWFDLIKDKYLPELMSEGPETSHFIIPLLSRAFSFSKENVCRLIKDKWLKKGEYDEVILNLFTYLNDWDDISVEIICVIANRHQSHWIPHIADLVSQNKPDLAPKIVRADFERRKKEAVKKDEENLKTPPPSPDASDEEKMVYDLSTRKGREICKLLENDSEWHELSQIAETSPKPFIDSLWPWFNLIVERIVYDPHPFVTGYQEDHCLGTNFDRRYGSPDQPITAIHDAIIALTKKAPKLFIAFFNSNVNSPYVTVHRLLCAGLMNLTSLYPDVILDYLITDPRRFVIGDFEDCHKSSRQLITELLPHLDSEGRNKLENSIINWNRYYKEDPNASPQDRFERQKWNREHRLRLLRAFPEEYISKEGRQLREREERAFPNLVDWDARIGGGGFVGSPMSNDQMVKAKDEHILHLFDDLDDATEWQHPKRNWDNIGGSIQASREVAKFAEQNPERAAKLIHEFIPDKQERPAAMAMEGIAKSSFPSKKLFSLIGDLVKRGHSSFEFRREIARALETRAKNDKGLPENMINLLKEWLNEDPHPDLEEKNQNKDREERRQSILWGYGSSFFLPGGRDIYIGALVSGYLLREPPEYEGFAKIIESRLKLEKHPEIWKTTLHSMAFLYNWDRNKATYFFDNVITNFKQVRESKLGAREIGLILDLVPEQKTLRKMIWLSYDFTIGKLLHQVPRHDIIKKWLTMLVFSNSDFAQQAYGEFLMLLFFRKVKGKWIKKQISTSLNKNNAQMIHRGLAFAISYNWNSIPYQDQEFCTEVFVRLCNSNDEVVQEAISQLFLYGEQIIFNDQMKKIIEAMLPHDKILLKSADRLIEGIMDQTSTEPDLIARICNRVLEAGKSEIQNVGSRFAFIAEPIVSIALTLHRKPEPHRTIGLDLFEKLIDSNISYARQALEILDRKPVTTHAPRPMRRRRRRNI